MKKILSAHVLFLAAMGMLASCSDSSKSSEEYIYFVYKNQTDQSVTLHNYNGSSGDVYYSTASIAAKDSVSMRVVFNAINPTDERRIPVMADSVMISADGQTPVWYRRGDSQPNNITNLQNYRSSCQSVSVTYHRYYLPEDLFGVGALPSK